MNKIRMPILATSINTALNVLATAVRQEKEIKSIQNGRKEVKLSLFKDKIILSIENTKVSTKKTIKTNK